MPKLFTLISFLWIQLFSLEFTVASYNPENLFDLQKDGTEYEEYIPYSQAWDKKAFTTKLENTAKVINQLNADILVLEEIENKNTLLLLMQKLRYKYFVFDKKPKSAIGLAIISKYPILTKEVIDVDPKADLERNILKATLKIEDKKFVVYANHWRSKRTTESKRVKYALALLNHIKHKGIDDEYLIAGDLNSNYDEFITFKYEKELNDTSGITGINQVLNTIIDGNFVTKENILSYSQIVHFNPWLELPKEERFSVKFRKENGTPDNIILSKNLFDNKGISYIQNSFKVFKPSYLLSQNGMIQRWNGKKKEGFSDHLPIIAQFTTQATKITSTHNGKKESKKSIPSSIKELYGISTLNDTISLSNVIVTYKTDKFAIIKGGNNDRSIQYYNQENQLEAGAIYDIEVNEIDDYFGAKEIKNLTIISKKSRVSNIKNYYLNGATIDLDNPKYQNEVITNLRGIYKNNHLHYENKTGKQKIKIYFKKELQKPKDGLYFVLESGVLSTYKSKNQILIHSDKDYKIYSKK